MSNTFLTTLSSTACCSNANPTCLRHRFCTSRTKTISSDYVKALRILLDCCITKGCSKSLSPEKHDRRNQVLAFSSALHFSHSSFLKVTVALWIYLHNKPNWRADKMLNAIGSLHCEWSSALCFSDQAETRLMSFVCPSAVHLLLPT